jgi:hypothetical protein
MSCKRLNYSYENKTSEGSIIHKKQNWGSASLALLVKGFHFFFSFGEIGLSNRRNSKNKYTYGSYSTSVGNNMI